MFKIKFCFKNSTQWLWSTAAGEIEFTRGDYGTLRDTCGAGDESGAYQFGVVLFGAEPQFFQQKQLIKFNVLIFYIFKCLPKFV